MALSLSLFSFIGMDLLVNNISTISVCQDKVSAEKTIFEFANLLYSTNRWDEVRLALVRKDSV
jgi:hypothetical protein